MRGPGRARLCALVLCVATAVAAEWDAWKPTGKCVISPAPCHDGYVEIENRSVYNICPGCVKTLGENEACDGKSAPCPHSFVCEGGKCVPGECKKEQNKEHATWAPKCNRDSTFQPVQCKGSKGDGRCFCWSPEGERLFGQADWTDSTENDMHCSCSLRAWQLKQQGQGAHELPRCAADGSFEALQCARGVCWCADAKTGAPLRRVVPQAAAHMLFCYRAEAVGEGYRRRCDSLMEARARIVEMMEAHGTGAYGLPFVDCDLDGSFAPVQDAENGARFCARKNNTMIKGYMDGDGTNMNCNCARDDDLEQHQKTCLGNGNYDPKQKDGEDHYCVDQDGYFTKKVSSTDSCTS